MKKGFLNFLLTVFFILLVLADIGLSLKYFAKEEWINGIVFAILSIIITFSIFYFLINNLRK
jgi:hypothetical protein